MFFIDEEVLKPIKERKEKMRMLRDALLIEKNDLQEESVRVDEDFILSLIEFSFEAPNYIPELAGKTVHVINIDRAFENMLELRSKNWIDFFKPTNKEMEEDNNGESTSL